MVQAWPVKSYRELRYEHVRGQNTTGSCGPASLATLFSVFYGAKTTEEEIIELMKPYLADELEKLQEGELPEGGVSMLNLKQVSGKIGIPSKGYSIPKENFSTLLEKLKSPLLIHLENPDEHFVLAVGNLPAGVVLADPSWGIRIMAKEDLFTKWDGLVLAFATPDRYRDNSVNVTHLVKKRLKARDKIQDLSLEFLWSFHL